MAFWPSVLCDGGGGGDITGIVRYWKLIPPFRSCFPRLLIEYTKHNSDWFGEWQEWKGYAYSGAMFLTAIIQSIALQQSNQRSITVGMRVQSAITGLVYEKVNGTGFIWVSNVTAVCFGFALVASVISQRNSLQYLIQMRS